MPPPTMQRPPTCPVQSQGLVRNVSWRRPPRLFGKGGGGGGGRGQEGRGGEEGGDAAEALAHGAHAPDALGAVAAAAGGGGTYDVTDAPGALLLRRGGTCARCFREGGRLGRVGLLLWRRAQIGWTFSAVGKG